MSIYILGITPQEKGQQLEDLVKGILAQKGYSALMRRYVSSGGHEIDIHGQINIPMIGKSQKIDVICECKAHEKIIDMTG